MPSQFSSGVKFEIGIGWRKLVTIRIHPFGRLKAINFMTAFGPSRDSRRWRRRLLAEKNLNAYILPRRIQRLLFALSESRNSPRRPSFGGQGKIEARSRRQLVFRCNDSLVAP